MSHKAQYTGVLRVGRRVDPSLFVVFGCGGGRGGRTLFSVVVFFPGERLSPVSCCAEIIQVPTREFHCVCLFRCLLRGNPIDIRRRYIHLAVRKLTPLQGGAVDAAETRMEMGSGAMGRVRAREGGGPVYRWGSWRVSTGQRIGW